MCYCILASKTARSVQPSTSVGTSERLRPVAKEKKKGKVEVAARGSPESSPPVLSSSVEQSRTICRKGLDQVISRSDLSSIRTFSVWLTPSLPSVRGWKVSVHDKVQCYIVQDGRECFVLPMTATPTHTHTHEHARALSLSLLLRIL